MLRVLSFIAVFIFTASAVQAAPEKYEFEKPHSQITFYVSHLGFSNSHGKFLDFDGYYIFDRDNPANSETKVSIKTKSIDMDDAVWNEHMQAVKWFNAEAYPEITFESTDIDVTGEKTGKITGNLTILDVTRPVTLDVLHNKSDKHPFSGKYTSGFTATTSLKRSDFGMESSLPMVGDDVTIRIEVEGYCVENCPENLNE